MVKNLVYRKNYQTMNQCKANKSTQTSTQVKDYIENFIEYCVSCCCPMPINKPNNNTFIEPEKDWIVTKQPNKNKMNRKDLSILRDIDDSFGESNLDDEDWEHISITI